MQFKYLFTPIQVGPMLLRNRIVSPPHATNFGMDDDREMYYQAEKAKGGVALCCLGIAMVDPEQACVMPSVVPANIDDRIIPWYRGIAEAVHSYGGKVAGQLAHMGANAHFRAFLPQTVVPVAASPIPSDLYRAVPHEISSEEMQRIATCFGLAAARAKAGGLDGVIIHAGHGNLLSGFLSPLFNTRDDEFGGTLENRMKFVFMVIHEIRRNIGQDMALGIRISGDEFMEGGITSDDSKAIAVSLAQSGLIDWIDVSSGNDGNLLSRAMHYSPMYVRPGAMVPLAAAIKEVVDVPVMAVGRINDPVLAEKILADGHADLIGMARACIADPHMPNKAKADQLEDIRQCVGINDGCVGLVFSGKPVSCVQNPVVGREKEWAELKPASAKKRVMVVGGGPAGLEAARVCALRGHDVSLYEKDGALGGQILVASKAVGRAELAGIARWLIYQVEKLHIDIHLNEKVTPESVAKEEPDALVVATGSIPARPSIPGADDENLVDVRSVLLGKIEIGQRVVVIDGTGYAAACTVADTLAEQGKQVYILAKGYIIGDCIDEFTRPILYRRLLEQAVVFMPLTHIRSVAGKAVVTYNTFSFQESKIDGVDTIVYDYSAPNDKLYRMLRGKVKELYRIGDCVTPRLIGHAIFDGGMLGRML